MTKKDYVKLAQSLIYTRHRYSYAEWSAAYRIIVDILREFDNFDLTKFQVFMSKNMEHNINEFPI